MRDILKLIPILIAAVILGRWYHSEALRNRARGLPWYRVYLTLPGLLILAAILLPVILTMTRQ